jgi:hypothetical protein
MKYKLIDFKLIDGLYIERQKNLGVEAYEIEDRGQIITFKSK